MTRIPQTLRFVLKMFRKRQEDGKNTDVNGSAKRKWYNVLNSCCRHGDNEERREMDLVRLIDELCKLPIERLLSVAFPLQSINHFGVGG